MRNFLVSVSAKAVVHADTVVEAKNAQAAREIALIEAMKGDLVWRYDGVEDDSLIVNHIESKEKENA